MRAPRFGLFRRIYLVVFLLIALLGVVFTGITYLVTTKFYEASTQLLNKDVAAHIARFTSPYGREGFDRRKADSVFYDAMVISPSAEVYFLDTAGRVIYFHGDSAGIKRWQVSVEDIRSYIGSGGQRYIRGPDPRDPEHHKIFSAAAVVGQAEAGQAPKSERGQRSDGERGQRSDGRDEPLGYIYVVLGNSQYRSVTQMLYNSRITPVFLGAIVFILSISVLVTLLYIRRIRRRFLLLDKVERVTASEKERRDFMVNISHDLRTPLAIARGFAETLALKEGQMPPEEERGYADLVVGKIRYVEKMVNQLFELSKMESASFETRREPFVFSEILQEIIQDVRPADGGPVLECRHCTDGSYVMADISMMERVLQNLVVNAIAYSPQSGKIIINLEKTGDVLVFSIANEGKLLPADLLEWLNSTDPERLRPVRPAIGLTIVRKILLLHHFPLTVETRPGGVNFFSFRLPVYRVTE